MVRHIVMWNLSKELDDDAREKAIMTIKEKLEGLSGKIDGLIYIKVGVNFNPNGYDLCLVTDFKDKQALDLYQDHPLHVVCKAYIHTVVTERVVCDYVM